MIEFHQEAWIVYEKGGDNLPHNVNAFCDDAELITFLKTNTTEERHFLVARGKIIDG